MQPVFLYDVFYGKKDMDSNVPLTSDYDPGSLAVCANAEKEYLIKTNKGWKKVTQQEWQQALDKLLHP